MRLPDHIQQLIDNGMLRIVYVRHKRKRARFCKAVGR